MFLQKNSAISSFFSTDLSHILFGTSSPAYEGWRGLVYQRTDPKSRCSQDALAEYADYAVDGEELFSTVGIDHSIYRPASAKQLAHYARKVSVGSDGCVQQRRSYGYWDKEYLRLKIPIAFLP